MNGSASLFGVGGHRETFGDVLVCVVGTGRGTAAGFSSSGEGVEGGHSVREVVYGLVYIWRSVSVWVFFPLR
jgi:hypothetical protein